MFSQFKSKHHILLRMAIVVASALIVFGFILKPYILETKGPFGGHQLRFVFKQAYSLGTPTAGDIVVFSLIGGSKSMAAQVVAAAGDSIDTIDGQLFINGNPIPQHSMKMTNKTYDSRELLDDEVLLATINFPPQFLGILNTSVLVGKLL